MQQSKSPLRIGERNASACSNLRLNNPFGALNNEIGMEKWATAGAGNPILALWQIGGRKLTYLTGFSTALGSEIETGVWYIDKPVYVPDLETFIYQGGYNTTLRKSDIVAAPSGNIYVGRSNASLLRQIGGVGEFTFFNSQNCSHLCVTQSGHLYMCNGLNSTIRRVSNEASAVAGEYLSPISASRNWTGITSTKSDHIYACVYNGLIYKQTNATGSFVAVTSGNKEWDFVMGSRFSDDVFAYETTTAEGGLWKQTGGTGAFSLICTGYDFYSWPPFISESGDFYFLNSYPKVLYKIPNGETTPVAILSKDDSMFYDIRGFLITSSDDLYITGDADYDYNSETYSNIFKRAAGTVDFIEQDYVPCEYYSNVAASSKMIETHDHSIYTMDIYGGMWKYTYGT